MPRETQDEFRARLRQTGKLDDFLARKADLIAEGMSKKASWEKAASEFGFGNVNHSGSNGSSTTIKPSLFKGKDSSIRDDFDWVYRHMGLPDAARAAASAYGHTSLLLELPFAGDLGAFPCREPIPLVARRPRVPGAEGRRRLGLEEVHRAGH